ncbi:hypothetical protein L1987_23985 [Smallanthus sonchifolius]|uniref:Uncharacterized protein n=1 Tax=Smallanthus sonchifolius TaxID=185202 RepID=A0ACB9IIF9_9ASTR|nr:hypothetical protein L1987_23985 [Smallanthus sonchifolius]
MCVSQNKHMVIVEFRVCKTIKDGGIYDHVCVYSYSNIMYALWLASDSEYVGKRMEEEVFITHLDPQ